MAQVIRLKRHIGSALTPTAGAGATQLSVGELAYERQSAAGAAAGPDNLWVSDGTNVHPLVSSSRQLELTGAAQTVNKVVTFGSFPVLPAGTANQVLTTTDAAGTLAWAAPVVVPPALTLKGEFNATPPNGTIENAVAPLANGALPAAAPANNGFFLIVNTEGTITGGNAPHDHLAVGDWIVSTGTAWIHINLHFAIVAASNVAVSAPFPGAPTDVQAALEFLRARNVTVGATDPATGMQAGDLHYNTSAPAQLKVYNGTAWVSVTPPAAAATVVSDQTSIHGDGAATGTYPATGPLTVALVDGGAYA